MTAPARPKALGHWATFDETGIAHLYGGAPRMQFAACDRELHPREERYERAIRAKCVRCLTVEKYGPAPA